ncbi:MAG: polysaccharide deacetylase family protein [Solobacterium sp.]|nr:polysaccharide deacetylase family protein [Solobacterium sp.]
MNHLVGKLKEYMLSEIFCTLFFMIVLTVNHVSLYYLDVYLRPLFLVSYLWVLIIYLYHTLITRKYLTGNLFRIAHVFLIINVVFTFIWPENRRISVLQDFAQLILYMFVAFGAFYHHDGKNDRVRMEKLLHFFVAATFVVSLASLAAIYLKSDLISIQPNYPESRQRGFYYETNEGGLNAFASIILGLYFFWKNREIYGKKAAASDIIYVLNVFVQLDMIRANGSRTSLLVLMAMAVIMLLTTLKKRTEKDLPKWILYAAGAVIAAACYVLLFTRYGFERNVYYYLSEVSSLGSLTKDELMNLLSRMSSFRFYIWKTSFEEIAKHPFRGYGLKSANFTYTIYRGFSNSHNLLINTLLFSGVTGTAVLTLYGIECALQSSRNARSSVDKYLKAFVLGYLAVSMLEMAFLYNGKALSALCWCTLGYLTSPKDELAADAENSITVVERVKNAAAIIMNCLGITNLMIRKCYADPQMIRVVNYHRTPDNELKTFEKQLKWYRKHFENVDRTRFERFMNGEHQFVKPGIILSFDDGLLNNYENAAPLLEQYGFTGWFFVSSGLADGTEYMTYEDMADLAKRGHVLGCHTFSHHRMEENDTPEILDHEIAEARQVLSERTGTDIDIFCWCGGEEDTYTKIAADEIRRHYRWGFMTNNEPVRSDTDHYQLQRTNVEARWPLSTAKLQLSGLMDRVYRDKRERVIEKTKES